MLIENAVFNLQLSYIGLEHYTLSANHICASQHRLGARPYYIDDAVLQLCVCLDFDNARSAYLK